MKLKNYDDEPSLRGRYKDYEVRGTTVRVGFGRFTVFSQSGTRLGSGEIKDGRATYAAGSGQGCPSTAAIEFAMGLRKPPTIVKAKAVSTDRRDPSRSKAKKD